MKKITLIFLIFLSTTYFGQVNVTEEIEISELQDHLNYLATEKCEGRKPGKKGGLLAAQYIRDNLLELDISPLGENGFQYFEFVKSLKLGENNQVKYEGKDLVLDKDFAPLIISASDTLNTDIAFVGYGFDFETDKLKWNDYNDIDVKGKWVMIMRGSPQTEIGDDTFEPYAGIRKKILVAADHGAAGVIFVSGEKFDKEDNLLEAAYGMRQTSVDVPVIHLKRNLANEMLYKTGIELVQLEEHYEIEKIPYSFDINKNLFAITDIFEDKGKTQNVAFLMEGSDPQLKDEIVVIGAHYDHLGYGGEGSGSRTPDTTAIHFGADDNASGVAAIMEVMERCALNKDKIKRSILFLAFGAEEMGLLGSKHFIQNPLVELEKINCMLNFDMVGRLDTSEYSITIGGTGTAAEYDSILDELLAESKLKVDRSPEGYGPSDHASFYSKDIPVMFMFTGVHPDYHTPRDQVKYINFDGQKLISDFAFSLTENIANKDVKLTFKEAGPKEQKSTRRKFKVTLGIMPDVASTTKNGLKVDAVMDGRPAQKGGMQKGDIIVALDGKPVKDIYDYMNRLSDFKKGQQITVDVMRDKKKVVLLVIL